MSLRFNAKDVQKIIFDEEKADTASEEEEESNFWEEQDYSDDESLR